MGTTSEGPFLVVLDNVPEPAAGASPPSLGQLFPGRRWVTLLATSRRRLDEARSATLAVDVLDEEPARALLTQGAAQVAELSESAWDEVAAWVGRLPLALELLNRGLVNDVLTTAELQQAARGLSPVEVADAARDALRGHVADSALRGISEAFHLTCSRLSEPAQDVARASAFFTPAALSDALVYELCATTGGSAMRATLASRSVWTRVPAAETRAGRCTDSWPTSSG